MTEFSKYINELRTTLIKAHETKFILDNQEKINKLTLKICQYLDKNKNSKSKYIKELINIWKTESSKMIHRDFKIVESESE